MAAPSLKTAEAGTDLEAAREFLERARAQSKLDLAAVRKTEAYSTAYNAETNRLLLLPPKQRLAGCQSAL